MSLHRVSTQIECDMGADDGGRGRVRKASRQERRPGHSKSPSSAMSRSSSRESDHSPRQGRPRFATVTPQAPQRPQNPLLAASWCGDISRLEKERQVATAGNKKSATGGVCDLISSVRDEKGLTALHFAVGAGRQSLVEWILDSCRAEALMDSEQGHSSLDKKVECFVREEVDEWFSEVSSRNGEKVSARVKRFEAWVSDQRRRLTCQGELASETKWCELVSIKDSDGRTCLHWAAGRQGGSPILSELLSRGRGHLSARVPYILRDRRVLLILREGLLGGQNRAYLMQNLERALFFKDRNNASTATYGEHEAPLAFPRGGKIDVRTGETFTAMDVDLMLHVDSLGRKLTDVATIREHRLSIINLQDASGWTPLMHASSSSDCDSVKLLLRHGAEPDLGTCMDTPVSLATTSPIFRLLAAALRRAYLRITKHPPVSHGGGNEDAALDRKIAGRLLSQMQEAEEGCDYQENLSSTLHLAASSGDPELLKMRLEYIDNNASSSHGGVDDTDRSGWQPLHHACSELDYTSALLLIDAGANVNAASLSGKTPLHVACSSQKKGPISDKQCARVTQLLLTNGARCEARDEVGLTPLSAAAAHGKSRAMLALLLKGASAKSRDNRGYCAAHCAAAAGHIECCRILAKWDADEIVAAAVYLKDAPNIPSTAAGRVASTSAVRNSFRTPWEAATRWDVALLSKTLQQGTKQLDGNRSGHLGGGVASSEKDAEISEKRAMGSQRPPTANSKTFGLELTPLHCALLAMARQSRGYDLIRFRHMDLGAKELNARRSCARGAMSGSGGACSKRCLAVVDQLLRSGSLPSATDSRSCTPLMLAAAIGDLDILDTLLKRLQPGDVDAADLGGNTALHYAEMFGSPMAAAHLVKKGGANETLTNSQGMMPKEVAGCLYKWAPRRHVCRTAKPPHCKRFE